MNFLTWPFRCERYYRHHKTAIIMIGILALFLVIFLWGFGFYLYYASQKLHEDIYEMQAVGSANHEAVQKYEKVIQQRLTKDLKHSTGQSILLHTVDCANSQIVLDTVNFTDDGFNVTGICTKPEVVLAYSQRLKRSLKGVIVNAKQGIDANRKIHTFQLSGKFEKAKPQPKKDTPNSR